MDAAHSAILSSMRSDGLDARAYLDERRAAFHGVASDEEEQRNAFLAMQGNSCCESGAGSLCSWDKTAFRACSCVCVKELHDCLGWYPAKPNGASPAVRSVGGTVKETSS